MCKPLKDIVAELEAKHGVPGLVSLEKRSIVIRDYEACMEYLLNMMDSYVYEVKYTLEHNLSLSIISRITQNLIIHMVHAHIIMGPYSDAIVLFLMDERYDQNYKYWKDFDDRAGEIKSLLKKLDDNNVFCVDETKEDPYLIYYDVVKGFDDKVPPEVIQENILAIRTGEKLLECLCSVIEMMDKELDLVKTKGLWLEEKIVAEFYELNYLLYATEYWPAVGRNFRPHIIKHYLKGNVSISELERLRLDKVRDFENHTDTGKIWRDYSEDTFQLASHLKEQIKTDDEWKYFFKCIFELEEYDRWIEEETLKSEGKDEVKANAVREAIVEVMGLKDSAGKYVFQQQSQWEGIYVVLKIKKYYPGFPRDFQDYLREIGLDDNLRLHLPGKNVARNGIYGKISSLDGWKPKGTQETRIHAVAEKFNEELEKRLPKI